MANQRHGCDRAATQNKLVQVWLQVDSNSVYVTESECGSPVMKSKSKRKRGGKEKIERRVYLVGGCRGNSI